MSDFFVTIITDQEYLDLVKLWESGDPIDSNEMIEMIEYCIKKYSASAESKNELREQHEVKS